MATQTVQVRIDARNIWQQTQVVVQLGDQLSVSVPNSGLPNPNHPKPWPWGPNCDPDGNRTDGIDPTTWSGAIASEIVQFSLIGRVGENGTPFLIGSSFNQLAPASGCLYLSFNDGVNFNDNSGYWDVEITYEECIVLPEAYGQNRVKIDSINFSLFDTYGVVLTVQCDTTDVDAVWNSTVINKLVEALALIDTRLNSQTTRNFREVFGGVEFRLLNSLPNDIGAITPNNGNVIQIGDVGRDGGTRPDDGSYGIPNNGYQSLPPYGLLVNDPLGIQNTMIHELGHVFFGRSSSLRANPFNLDAVYATPPETNEAIFWENNFEPIEGEFIPDHFLNWVRDTYIDPDGDQYDVDDYEADASDNIRRITAFWIGDVEFIESGVSRGTSVGIQGFADEAYSVASELLSSLSELRACIE